MVASCLTVLFAARRLLSLPPLSTSICRKIRLQKYREVGLERLHALDNRSIANVFCTVSPNPSTLLRNPSDLAYVENYSKPVFERSKSASSLRNANSRTRVSLSQT